MAEVLSPIPGTFYRKPNPDAAPYVEVGSVVEADTTVCLVEVMKTFNEIQRKRYIVFVSVFLSRI